MGRRADETEVEKLPAEISDALDDLFEAFGNLRFPNKAMVVLAELALTEYRLAVRSIDRKHWHGQLVNVAKVCAEFDKGTADEPKNDHDLEAVVHEDGDERPNEEQRRDPDD